MSYASCSWDTEISDFGPYGEGSSVNSFSLCFDAALTSVTALLPLSEHTDG